MRKTLKRIGSAMIVLGVAIPACVYAYVLSIRWNPLNKRASLTGGFLQETFRVNYTARYFATIGFDTHSMPLNKLLCLVGERQSPDVLQGCKPSDAVLEFSWELSRNHTIIQSGRYDQTNSGGAYSRGTVDADITYFDGKRGEVYTLRVHDVSPGVRVLETSDPRIRVSVNEVNLAFALVLQGISRVLAVILIVAGGAFLLFARPLGRPRPIGA